VRAHLLEEAGGGVSELVPALTGEELLAAHAQRDAVAQAVLDTLGGSR
jgi:hypothetical protein